MIFRKVNIILKVDPSSPEGQSLLDAFFSRPQYRVDPLDMASPFAFTQDTSDPESRRVASLMSNPPTLVWGEYHPSEPNPDNWTEQTREGWIMQHLYLSPQFVADALNQPVDGHQTPDEIASGTPVETFQPARQPGDDEIFTNVTVDLLPPTS